MPDLVQRYARAVSSSDLQCDAYHVDTDVLMAIALAGGLAAPLSRVKYLHEASAYKGLLATWRGIVCRKAALRHWPSHVNPMLVAKVSLDYWIGDQCIDCNGTGFPVLRGIPTRSPKACAVCDGSGRRPIQCPRQIREQALDMYQDLCAIFDKAAQRAKRKLRG